MSPSLRTALQEATEALMDECYERGLQRVGSVPFLSKDKQFMAVRMKGLIDQVPLRTFVSMDLKARENGETGE